MWGRKGGSCRGRVGWMSGYTGGLGNSYLGNFGCGSCWVARWFGLSGAGRGV